jgi:hypothetical protein
MAKEEDSAGGQTKTYQTVMHKTPAGKPPRVLSFRECEVEQGNYEGISFNLRKIYFSLAQYLLLFLFFFEVGTGNIRGKEWRWKGHEA